MAGISERAEICKYKCTSRIILQYCPHGKGREKDDTYVISLWFVTHVTDCLVPSMFCSKIGTNCDFLWANMLLIIKPL